MNDGKFDRVGVCVCVCVCARTDKWKRRLLKSLIDAPCFSTSPFCQSRSLSWPVLVLA